MSLPAKYGEDSDDARVSSERTNRNRTQNAKFEDGIANGTEQMRSEGPAAIGLEQTQSSEIQNTGQMEFQRGQQRSEENIVESRGIKRRNGNEGEHGDLKVSRSVLANVEKRAMEDSKAVLWRPIKMAENLDRQPGNLQVIQQRDVDNTTEMAILQSRTDKEEALENVHIGNTEPLPARKLLDIDSSAVAHEVIEEDEQEESDIKDTSVMKRATETKKTQQISTCIGQTQPLPPRNFFDIGEENIRRALCSTCKERLRCVVHIPCGCIITCGVCTAEESHCVSCLRAVETKIKVAE